MTNAEAWEFIEVSASTIGVGSEALRKWRRRGVPHRWRLALMERARATGTDLPISAFDAPPKPVCTQSTSAAA